MSQKYKVGFATEYKEIVAESDELTSSGGRKFMWRCLSCLKVHGPTYGPEIFRYKRAACCAVTTKWSVGDTVTGAAHDGKLLTQYHGKNKWGQKVFTYMCQRCDKEYGPTSINSILRDTPTICCRPGRKYGRAFSGYKTIPRDKVVRLFRSANSRGIEFDLEAKHLHDQWISQGGVCHYTGIELLPDFSNASVDRTNPEKGYVRGNIKWVHKHVNTMKWDLQEDIFIELCSLVVSREKEKRNEQDSK